MKNNLLLLLSLMPSLALSCPENLHFDAVCRNDIPYSEALPNCIKRAEQGTPRDMTVLANFLSPKNGHGDLEAARQWFIKAIDQGYAPAMYYYATLTLMSYPVGEKTAHAKKILQEGANRGDPDAMAQLGYELNAGTGEFKNELDPILSFDLLLKAAKKKNAFAQKQLVERHLEKRDFIEAYAWNLVVQEGDDLHPSFKPIVDNLSNEQMKMARELGIEYRRAYGSVNCKKPGQK